MNRIAPPPVRPATYRDLLEAAPHMMAELVRGALHLHPRPAARHARAASTFGMDLGGPFDPGRGDPAAGGSSTSRS